jgi:hypothetical protein
MTIWRMRIACYLRKATDPHSEYVFLTAFPLRRWLYGHASMLRYTYIASIVQWLINFVYILFLSCRLDVYYALLYFFFKEIQT